MAFCPPVLEMTDIVSAFRENQIDFNESDLTHPDPRRWREIYGHIFETLTNVPIMQAVQSVCARGMMRTEYSDIYEEGFSLFAFTLCMQRVLCSCGVRKFTVKDTVSPTPKRVAFIASAFINMIRHRGLRADFISEIKQGAEHSRDEYETALKRYDELKQRLEKANETKEEREMELQKGQEEMKEAHQKLQELFEQQTTIKKNSEDLNVYIAEKATVKDNIKQFILAEQQEGEKLSKKIVQSPDRFKQEQERLKKRILELKAELTKKEQVLSENKQLLEQTECKRSTAERAVKMSKELNEELDKENEISVEIQKLKESHGELAEVHKSLWTTEEDLKEKLAVRMEQKRKILCQTENSKSHYDQRFIELKQHAIHLEKGMKSHMTEVAQLRQKTEAILEEVSLAEELMEEKKQAWKTDFTEMLNEIDVLHTLAANGFAAIKDEQQSTTMSN